MEKPLIPLPYFFTIVVVWGVLFLTAQLFPILSFPLFYILLPSVAVGGLYGYRKFPPPNLPEDAVDEHDETNEGLFSNIIWHAFIGLFVGAVLSSLFFGSFGGGPSEPCSGWGKC